MEYLPTLAINITQSCRCVYIIIYINIYYTYIYIYYYIHVSAQWSLWFMATSAWFPGPSFLETAEAARFGGDRACGAWRCIEEIRGVIQDDSSPICSMEYLATYPTLIHFNGPVLSANVHKYTIHG